MNNPRTPCLLALGSALSLTLLASGCNKPDATSAAPAASSVAIVQSDRAASTPGASGATTAPSGSTATTAAAASAAEGGAGAAAGSSSGLYKVVDGNKVDPETMKGFRAWRSAACDRCHGPNQEGMVGPSLITSLKTLSKEDFIKAVAEGRLEKGMPAFKTNQAVMDNINPLYAYLKGRSDGAITSAKVEEMK